MALLASDVMDESRALLNDVGATLYTNTLMLPYLKKANEDLELLFLVHGIEVQRVRSAVIDVAALAVTVTLPTDFLLPISLKERADGSSDSWTPMAEANWEPETTEQTTTLGVWAFRNNAINLIGATTAREVLLEYDRQLAIIIGASSPEDVSLSKTYLAARTAELCARYIGMNKTVADDLGGREVNVSEDNLIRAFVLNGQGLRFRRGRFNTNRYSSLG